MHCQLTASFTQYYTILRVRSLTNILYHLVSSCIASSYILLLHIMNPKYVILFQIANIMLQRKNQKSFMFMCIFAIPSIFHPCCNIHGSSGNQHQQDIYNLWEEINCKDWLFWLWSLAKFMTSHPQTACPGKQCVLLAKIRSVGPQRRHWHKSQLKSNVQEALSEAREDSALVRQKNTCTLPLPFQLIVR